MSIVGAPDFLQALFIDGLVRQTLPAKDEIGAEDNAILVFPEEGL